jgi:16S rRNA G966 N2-methylase RsmD
LIHDLLKPEVISFILENENADISHILLKHKEIHGVPAPAIANQMKGRLKAKDKLPSYYQNPQICYPPQINLEQSSSERTAIFKRDFIRSQSGKDIATSGIDLTGGFGIDACFMSEGFADFTFVEPNEELLNIARHNHQILGKENIGYANSTAESFLTNSVSSDFIFIDPSRRNEADKKVSSFADCEPNILPLQETIFQKTTHLLVKASPMLDVQLGLKELKFVKTVVVLSVDNECKELLFYCERGFEGEALVKAVNLINSKIDSFEFFLSDEKDIEVEFSEPAQYLYEPNASILKAGAFKSIAKSLALKKLHPSTHLYTSDQLLEKFPGRIFKVIALVKPDPKNLKQYFPDQKANVTTRNYPLSVAELKQKTKLKDGGDKYLIGFSGPNSKLVVVAERVK